MITKLEKMLKYVSEHNEFYMNRIKEYGITNPLDITQWPVLTRKELQENRYNMFSDGYKSKYLNYQLRRHSSSGTSGVPVNVYWAQNDYMKSILSIWRKRWEWYGITAKDCLVSFELPYFGREEDFLLKINNKFLINAASLTSEERYKDVAEQISYFNPKWIYIQPFILSRLISCYKKYDIKPPSNLKYIESVGEILSSQLKMNAMDFFGIPIANLYGSQEQNGIAFECPCGKMHILDDNVYVEKNSIITNLNNYAFPLIRYEQGDIIKISSQPLNCKCGCYASHIELINGRVSESIKVSDKEINAYLLSEAINSVNNQFNGMISDYSFRYSLGTKTLQCEISTNNDYGNWQKNIISEISCELHRRFPIKDIHINVIIRCCEIYNLSKRRILSITP